MEDNVGQIALDTAANPNVENLLCGATGMKIRASLKEETEKLEVFMKEATLEKQTLQEEVDGETALHWAAEEGHAEIVEKLLDQWKW